MYSFLSWPHQHTHLQYSRAITLLRNTYLSLKILRTKPISENNCILSLESREKYNAFYTVLLYDNLAVILVFSLKM